jgi:hypothetical protein
MQLSRPYIILLGVVAVLGAAWMFVLRPHSSTPTPAPAPAATPAPHASLPGVNGLAHAVAKARGAVTLSQQNASQLAAKSAAASSSSASTAGTAASPASAGNSPSGRSVQPSPASKPLTPAAGTQAAAPTDRSTEVTGPLQQGKVVVILFWDSRSADDQAVMHQLNDVSRANGKVVVLQATPSQVATFGAVTRGVQVLETPTTMVIDRRGRATTLTGLTDATAIQQAISDAQRGAGAVQTPLLTSWSARSSRSQYIGRANNLCRKLLKGGSGSGTLQQQITSFHQLVQAQVAQVAQVHSIPEPTADRVILARWFGGLDRSLHEVDGAVSAAAARNFTSARSLLFAGQADYDRASQGLADYGLTACFAPESRNS